MKVINYVRLLAALPILLLGSGLLRLAVIIAGPANEDVLDEFTMDEDELEFDELQNTGGPTPPSPHR